MVTRCKAAICQSLADTANLSLYIRRAVFCWSTWEALDESIGPRVAYHHVLQHVPRQAKADVLAGRKAAHAVPAERVHARLVERGPGCDV